MHLCCISVCSMSKRLGLSGHASWNVPDRRLGKEEGLKGLKRIPHLLSVNLKCLGRKSCLHSGLLAVVEGVVNNARHQ